MTGHRVADWFDAFSSQSIAPSVLGKKLHWSYPLSGGLSGASAFLCLCDAGAIVLKWGPLEGVLREALARRGRIGEGQSNPAPTLAGLREKSASHIAIRREPGRAGKLYGIIAYAYAGAITAKDHGRISDFETMVQDRYVRDESVSDEQLEIVLGNAVRALEPRERAPGSSLLTPQLPDLLEIKDKLNGAQHILRVGGVPAPSLDDLDDWLDNFFREQLSPSFADSRMVHGDPRFANIMVDRSDNKVVLIDFGDGSGGRHLFHDLARFEVDVILRTTPPLDNGHRIEEVTDRTALLLGTKAEPDSLPRWLRVAALWRRVRDDQVTEIGGRKGVFGLYGIFMLNELLRRVKWYKQPDRKTEDVGATLEELVAVIESVRWALDEKRKLGR